MSPMTEPAAPAPRRPWQRRWVRLPIVLMVLYLLVCVLMYAFQDKLLFPGASTQGTPGSRAVDTDNTELVSLSTADGLALSGRFCPVAHDAGRAPTVLYFYGNASCAAWAIDEVNLLRSLGCNVFVPDFAGYGMSGGKANEASLLATATAAWDYLQARPGIDHSKVLIMGWSIGSAVAIDLASRTPAAGLITFSAFTRIADPAAGLYPWLPVRLLLRYHFDNLSKMPNVKCPVLIVHGNHDTLVPPYMADVLASVCKGSVSRLNLHDADHNTVFSVDTPALDASLRTFLKPFMSVN